MSAGIPRVSIAIPVFNGANYLRQTLDSLLAQTYRDFELIVSDNASMDATEEICRSYMASDDRVRYFRNAANLGAHVNFNRAFRVARGQYFKWAAHDDLCHPTFLSRCVEVLDGDPSVILCHAQPVLIDANGERIPHVAMTRRHFTDGSGRHVSIRGCDPPRRLDSPKAPRRFRDVILKTGWCFEIFGLIRVAALARTTALAEPYYGADKVTLAELSLLGRMVVLPEELFFRRCHPGQSTNLRSARGRALWAHPTATQRPIFSRLRCVGGYARSVLRADISNYERARCLLTLSRWPLRADRWRAMLRDAFNRSRGRGMLRVPGEDRNP
jgi:glycosyltransferase involved in cell wall biosynthesis